MKIYNTLSRKIEEFVPHNKDLVTMYTCGPTVYSYAHIGNLRTYISCDILEKSLRFLGYNVKRVMNITDVGHLTSDADSGEDKMVKGAKREGKTPQELASFYTSAFMKDLDLLNIKVPEIVEKATNHIDDYIHVIEVLISKGYAYVAGGNVYFDISRMPNYYELSNRDNNEMMVAVRDDISVDYNKKNPYDFVLWFTKSKFSDQDQKWDSPWGVGYPGWHIECSVLASIYLGEYLDIHCGGIDLVFPHHTNEIAQSEAYFGHKWCKYWFHGEFLNDKSGKMSKSNGEFLTLSLLIEKGYNPLSYRYLCLSSHYRKQLVFSYESLDMAERAYLKLLGRVKRLGNEGDINLEIVKKYKDKFCDSISNDLNTSSMLTLVYDSLKDNINDATKREIIKLFDSVLSLGLLDNVSLVVDEDFINKKIEERNVYKKNKDYVKADLVRDELKSMGIKLIDTSDGCIYEIGE